MARLWYDSAVTDPTGASASPEVPAGVYVVTGSASGIGAAVRTRLEADGHRVVGVDVQGADVEADLADPSDRARLADRVHEVAGPVLDGVVACAGISAFEARTVSVNHFGAVATLVGLRPLLAGSVRSRAVAIASVAARDGAPEVVEACLADDEPAALAAAERLVAAGNGYAVYPSSKRALAIWVRRNATTPEWAGAGIALNAVAPGIVLTPMTDPLFADPKMRPIMEEAVPMPLSGFAQPDQIAAVVCFLAGPENAVVTGQVVFADGGADALGHPELW